MKAAIYTPYLETLGGGERYMLSAAKVMADNGYSVYLESEDDKILQRAESRFNLDLSHIKLTDSINRGDGYDLCLWLSDGSIPALRARKNILHFQRPFYRVQGKSLLNRAKFFRINNVVVNSSFTKKWIDREYPVNSIVLYPPVDVDKFRSGKKENLILYVGRFSQLQQVKGQEVLVDAFKNFYDKGNKDFKLVIAGGSDVGRTDFVEQLKQSSLDYPIEILENIEFRKLKELFAKALFFWSASGYGVDTDKHPEKLEHFGMSVVEAMAAGCIPVIFAGGGHNEIIKQGENGILWQTPDQLVDFTDKLIDDTEHLKIISSTAKVDCQNYSYENFANNLTKLL